MGLRVVRHEHAREWLADAEGFLVEREEEHTLALGIASELVTGARSSTPAPFLAAAREGRRVVGVALQTPPHKVVVSCDRAAVARALAGTARHLGEVPGAVGPRASASLFAHAWGERAACVVAPRMAQWIYALRSRPAAIDVPGAARRAANDDLGVVRAWVEGFVREARIELPPSVALADECDRAARRWIAEQRLLLWEHEGEPVSMAGFGARTPRSARVSMVYTPAARRGRGFAAACTAAVSRRLFDDGCAFVCLVADQSNASSNAAYSRVGFERVCDQHEWSFSY
jgi:hypothetical protein